MHRVPKAMIRKQVYLTAELAERLGREAKRQRRTEAEVFREALAARLNATEPSSSDASEDALWQLVGIGASKEADLSERRLARWAL
jgi:predicted DNA-binding protein